MLRRFGAPFAIFLVVAAVYVAALGPRRLAPSANNHYVHLAASFLAGELGVLGNRPHGSNDWACFDTEAEGPCPPGRYSFSGEDAARYRWYVSFPPLPGVLLMPFVALWGEETPDRLLWALFAALGPALFFVLLRRLREEGRSHRSLRDDVFLTGLLAFGTVYFFVAVQGTVWFAAHAVAVPLLVLYLHYALGARCPWLAGLFLGLAFLTRPTTLLLGAIFLVEALAKARREDADGAAGTWWRAVFRWLRAVEWPRAARVLLAFAVPLAVIGLLQAWMNHARFHDPFEFGHTFLQIKWRARIETWGLFHTHYLAKNLAVFLAALPWISGEPPHITISRHGLALWFTTPVLLLALWPKRVGSTLVGLMLGVCAVAFVNLCYQNSGWVQFGYRFSLDYMVPLLVAIALGGRRFGGGVWLLAAFAVAVNAFGALTFDRQHRFYDRDNTQEVIFQPD